MGFSANRLETIRVNGLSLVSVRDSGSKPRALTKPFAALPLTSTSATRCAAPTLFSSGVARYSGDNTLSSPAFTFGSTSIESTMPPMADASSELARALPPAPSTPPKSAAAPKLIADSPYVRVSCDWCRAASVTAVEAVATLPVTTAASRIEFPALYVLAIAPPIGIRLIGSATPTTPRPTRNDIAPPFCIVSRSVVSLAYCLRTASISSTVSASAAWDTNFLSSFSPSDR